MRHLLAIVVAVCPVVLGADTAGRTETPSANASVSKCFKVRRLLRTDSTHYWADWTNTCPFTIDAVYVMVGFRDRGNQEMGSGVWPMYFVKPGVHRVTRFSAPVADFATVHVHRITTDAKVALVPDPGPAQPPSVVAPKPVESVGDKAIGKVIPYQPPAPPQTTKY